MEAQMDGTFHIQTGVADRVIAIVAEQAMLEPSQIAREARLDALGLDSLGLVETLFAIEESFDVSVPFNANDPSQSRFDLSTVGALIDGVEALIAAR